MSVLSYLASPFTDLDQKRSSEGRQVLVLDGVRGFAALIVIASHCDALALSGQGSVGVLLFFQLSGFLLTLQFVTKPARIFQPSVTFRFFVNRALRIYPLYVATVLCLTWWWGQEANWLWLHLTFQAGRGHLWSVAEEARFYLLLPLVIAVLALATGRIVKLLTVIVLLFLAYTVRTRYTIDMTEGVRVQFYFWFFLSGVLVCLLRDLVANHVEHSRIFQTTAGIASVIICAAVFLGSDNFVADLWRPMFDLPQDLLLNGWHQPEAWCVLFSILLLALAVYPKTLVGRFMTSRPMRHFGLLSYGLYLLHFPVLEWLQKQGYQYSGLLLLVVGVTYAAAYCSYLLIEQPFLMLKPKGPFRHSSIRSAARRACCRQTRSDLISRSD